MHEPRRPSLRALRDVALAGIADGRIVEHWREHDALEQMKPLGARYVDPGARDRFAPRGTNGQREAISAP